MVTPTVTSFLYYCHQSFPRLLSPPAWTVVVIIPSHSHPSPLTRASSSVLWLDSFDHIIAWLQTSGLSYFLKDKISTLYICVHSPVSNTQCDLPLALAGNPLHLSPSWMHTFKFYFHVLCSSISFSGNTPPLHIFLLKSHRFFKVQLKHHLPSEVFPDHSQKGSLPFQQIFAFSSYVARTRSLFCSVFLLMGELIHLCIHHWVVPRVETPSLFIEWMVV